ncbi:MULTISPECIES: ATP-binding cassette domain-containing protein [unclassified Enterococcus]|jgi:putative ABC transport system ATP-binding protein|uniref:ATP-binding cassette domain-containing protein n=1 Tax=unclassified Enterococcus TaxID=2608891 RepID=UPI003D291F33
MTEKLISITDAEKTIQNKTLFSISDFSINKGEIGIITGKSGAGKTTLLTILGLGDTFTKGRYLLFNQKAEHYSAKQKLLLKRQRISFLFQDYGLIEYETIGFNLEIGLKYVKLSKREKTLLMRQALEQVHLDKKLNTPISSLSGGEKQRVALARIILKPSDLILADEPTGSLDTQNRDHIARLLVGLTQMGKTLIMATHDPELVKLGDKQLEI